MTESSPRVTICVPTYNSASFLRESLDSILAQTYGNLEIIVSDNASQDDTVSILKLYAERYDIRLILNERNIGAGGNFNQLIENARGKYVAIYHSDDVFEPTIVEESVKIFESSPEVGLVSSMAAVIDADGNHLYDYVLPKEILKLGKEKYVLADAILGSLVSRQNKIFFVTPSVMVRSKVYGELGLFHTQAFGSSGDTEMWLRIARTYHVAVIDRKLVKYRIHQHQGSELEVRKHVGIPDVYKVIEEYSSIIDDAVVREKCGAFLEWTLFKTALKQNYKGLFAESGATLAKIKSKRYRFYRSILQTANFMRLKLHIWP